MLRHAHAGRRLTCCSLDLLVGEFVEIEALRRCRLGRGMTVNMSSFVGADEQARPLPSDRSLYWTIDALRDEPATITVGGELLVFPVSPGVEGLDVLRLLGAAVAVGEKRKSSRGRCPGRKVTRDGEFYGGCESASTWKLDMEGCSLVELGIQEFHAPRPSMHRCMSA
ncbi:hypothetical protein BR93DRAFT_330509 [Coniochaeta sp. PMI_546]|nr:hypothetical protein BR93DRAFT_330509 [Coniochaeta sp. PMI_546]